MEAYDLLLCLQSQGSGFGAGNDYSQPRCYQLLTNHAGANYPHTAGVDG